MTPSAIAPVLVALASASPALHPKGAAAQATAEIRPARTLELELLVETGRPMPGFKEVPQHYAINASKTVMNRRGDLAFVFGGGRGSQEHSELFLRRANGKLQTIQTQQKVQQVELLHLAGNGALTWKARNTIYQTHKGRTTELRLQDPTPLAIAQGFISYLEEERGRESTTKVLAGSFESPKLLAERGKQAPGLPAGMTFRALKAAHVAAGPYALVNGYFTGTGVGRNANALWMVSPRGCELVGDPTSGNLLPVSVGRKGTALLQTKDGYWVYRSGQLDELQPEGMPENSRIRSARVFDDDRIVLETNRNELWVGTPERVAPLQVPEYLNIDLRKWTSAGVFAYSTRTQDEERVDATWLTRLGDRRLLFRSDDRFRIAPGDERQAERVRIHYLSANGHAVLQVSFPNVFGERDASTAYFLSRSPWADTDRDATPEAAGAPASELSKDPARG